MGNAIAAGAVWADSIMEMVFVAWVFFACTFVGHGQYAIGLGVPHSNEFVNMCVSSYSILTRREHERC